MAQNQGGRRKPTLGKWGMLGLSQNIFTAPAQDQPPEGCAGNRKQGLLLAELTAGSSLWMCMCVWVNMHIPRYLFNIP